MIADHLAEFAGQPVYDLTRESPLPQPGCCRVSLTYEDHQQGCTWAEKFAALVAHRDASSLAGLVLGMWDYEYGEDSREVIGSLVAASDRLPNLRALFIGDITYDECELSWIRQSDLSLLLAAYPRLEHLGVRGGSGLTLAPFHSPHLRTVIVEASGLSSEMVQTMAASSLPNLEHLELWLGSAEYASTVTVSQLEPILWGTSLPRLARLGLCNSELADEIAVALAVSPVLKQLQVLDLSLGTLSDAGAVALLGAPALAALDTLDLHHHYCSESLMDALCALPPMVDVDMRQEPDEEGRRYVAHGE